MSSSSTIRPVWALWILHLLQISQRGSLGQCVTILWPCSWTDLPLLRFFFFFLESLESGSAAGGGGGSVFRKSSTVCISSPPATWSLVSDEAESPPGPWISSEPFEASFWAFHFCILSNNSRSSAISLNRIFFFFAVLDACLGGWESARFPSSHTCEESFLISAGLDMVEPGFPWEPPDELGNGLDWLATTGALGISLSFSTSLFTNDKCGTFPRISHSRVLPFLVKMHESPFHVKSNPFSRINSPREMSGGASAMTRKVSQQSNVATKMSAACLIVILPLAVTMCRGLTVYIFFLCGMVMSLGFITWNDAPLSITLVTVLPANAQMSGAPISVLVVWSPPELFQVHTTRCSFLSLLERSSLRASPLSHLSTVLASFANSMWRITRKRIRSIIFTDIAFPIICPSCLSGTQCLSFSGLNPWKRHISVIVMRLCTFVIQCPLNRERVRQGDTSLIANELAFAASQSRIQLSFLGFPPRPRIRDSCVWTLWAGNFERSSRRSEVAVFSLSRSPETGSQHPSGSGNLNWLESRELLGLALFLNPRQYHLDLDWGRPWSFVFIIWSWISYTEQPFESLMPCNMVITVLWYFPPSSLTKPSTFSRMKTLGCLTLMYLNNSKNSCPRPFSSSNPCSLPALEKGWHGNPAT